MSLLISGLTTLASMLFNAASGGSNKGGAARRQGDSPDAGPSVKVHLSHEAQALAGLAGQGAMFAQAVAPGAIQAVRSHASGSANQAVSTEDFQELLGRFGADAEQKKLLTAGFDTDKNGSISRSELLQGLGRTARNGGTDDFSQALLRLMDAAGDTNGTVSKQEFTALTTAFAAATRGQRA